MKKQKDIDFMDGVSLSGKFIAIIVLSTISSMYLGTELIGTLMVVAFLVFFHKMTVYILSGAFSLASRILKTIFHIIAKIIEAVGNAINKKIDSLNNPDRHEKYR